VLAHDDDEFYPVKDVYYALPGVTNRAGNKTQCDVFLEVPEHSNVSQEQLQARGWIVQRLTPMPN